MMNVVAKWPSENFLRCLYCHYVFDDQKEDFERIVTHLRSIGTFINTAKCISMAEGRRPIDGQYFHLSFDDGFRNIYTNALPILERLEIPAITFVPSAMIGADPEATEKFCVQVLEHNQAIEMMTWDEVTNLVARGYEIGSHTRRHSRLSEASSDNELLEDEIIGSKREIEDRLGQPCDYIAWPFGTQLDIDKTSINLVRESGYKACFGAYRGSVDVGRTSVFEIPRHHFEPQWPISHVTLFAKGNFESTS
ncbi:MAG: polysaccharide deacetylase family protein [Methyloligellaceae bacterium]